MNSAAPRSSLVCWNKSSSHDHALVCIPWAGAGAAPYRAWPRVLGDHTRVYGVRLGGRETRFSEPPPGSIAAAVAELAAAIAELPVARVHLHGHCSGAIIAFEVARVLRRTAGIPVTGLTIVSQVAPILLSGSPIEKDLQRYVPAELQREPEMAELLIPIIEADTRMIADYEYIPDEPLGIPITAIWGSSDDGLTDEDLAHWAAETTGRFARRVVEGAGPLSGDAGGLDLAREVRQAIEP